MLKKPRLFMLTEHSPFMMGFVFITPQDNAVVIDGGRPEDMPYLLQLVGEREIAAWILTHPHIDHISGLIDLVDKDLYTEHIRTIYYNFPSAAYVKECEPEATHTIDDFERILPKIKDKTVTVYPGMNITVDELNIDFLFVGGERYKHPIQSLAVNNSSIVFKVTAQDMKSVLFLGDLGPAGGKDLLECCAEQLPSDIVQMAHHGHSGVTKEVYEKIAPKACMWCCPEWLWEEEAIEFHPESWGTKKMREWMDELGVETNYVTKDGTLEITL